MKIRVKLSMVSESTSLERMEMLLASLKETTDATIFSAEVQRID
jgi:hypothetical protein